MTHSDAADGCEPRPQGPSAAMRLLAVLMLPCRPPAWSST